MSESGSPSVAAFLERAAGWLEATAHRRPRGSQVRWGEGTDRVALFRDSTADDERAQVEAARAWQRTKFDAGYGAISWPVEYGGAGFTAGHEAASPQLETEFGTPPFVKTVSISVSR